MDNTNIVFNAPSDIEEYIKICTERDLVIEELQKEQRRWTDEHMIVTKNASNGEVTIECDEINLEGLTINDVSIFVDINYNSESSNKTFEDSLSSTVSKTNYEIYNDSNKNGRYNNKNCDSAECVYYSNTISVA